MSFSHSMNSIPVGYPIQGCGQTVQGDVYPIQREVYPPVSKSVIADAVDIFMERCFCRFVLTKKMVRKFVDNMGNMQKRINGNKIRQPQFYQVFRLSYDDRQIARERLIELFHTYLNCLEGHFPWELYHKLYYLTAELNEIRSRGRATELVMLRRLVKRKFSQMDRALEDLSEGVDQEVKRFRGTFTCMPLYEDKSS